MTLAKKNRGQRLGMRGYVDILSEIAFEPATPIALSARTGLELTGLRNFLLRMVDMGLIYESQWVREPGKMPQPVYAFGIDKPRVPRPLTVDGNPSRHRSTTPRTTKPRIELLAFAQTIRALHLGATSRYELCDLSGIHSVTMTRLLRHMRRASPCSLVYVAEWLPRFDSVGPPTAQWKFGINKCNASRPRPQKPAEKKRKENAARKQRIELRAEAITLIHQMAGRAVPTLRA